MFKIREIKNRKFSSLAEWVFRTHLFHKSSVVFVIFCIDRNIGYLDFSILFIHIILYVIVNIKIGRIIDFFDHF